MLKCSAIMLNYAQVRWENYYAQNYSSIMCQGLIQSLLTNLVKIKGFTKWLDNKVTTQLNENSHYVYIM